MLTQLSMIRKITPYKKLMFETQFYSSWNIGFDVSYCSQALPPPLIPLSLLVPPGSLVPSFLLVLPSSFISTGTTRLCGSFVFVCPTQLSGSTPSAASIQFSGFASSSGFIGFSGSTPSSSFGWVRLAPSLRQLLCPHSYWLCLLSLHRHLTPLTVWFPLDPCAWY